MGFIWWGMVLVVVALLLQVSGVLPAGGAVEYIGWLLLLVGLVLMLADFVRARAPGRA
ncbi:MAG: hypothetical protein ACT4PT_09555 [Methanobacteriota archaeon]